MTPEDFKTADPTPFSGPLLALWHAAHDDWNRAHEIAQDLDTPEAAWVHAYLHRQEGDRANAAFWYRRAGRAVSADPLLDEWTAILRHLLHSR